MFDARQFNYPGITHNQSQKIKHIFETYTAHFRSNEEPVFQEHIKLKYEHIHRVCKEMLELSISFGMDIEQAEFTEVIALLHDIGRFEQFEKYGTFADAESENHSKIAVRVIKQLGINREFSSLQNDIIYQSILNHNIPKIPGSASDQIKFYSKLIRDADKLDIWRVTLKYNIFHKIRTDNFPSEYSISEELMNCFLENRIMMLSQVKSFYDSILFRLSWIYDLNFPFTIRQFSEREIAKQLLEKLPFSPQLATIEECIDAYIEQKLK